MCGAVADAADNSNGDGAHGTPGTKRPRRRAWRRLKWAVRIGLVLVLLGFLIVGFDGCFYYPSSRVFYTPAEFNLTHEEVAFYASDGVRLSGWFLPAQGPARGTVVHFHGNAENMTSHIAFVAWLPPAGYNLFVFDYRGYGKSAGRVSRAGTIRDGNAALEYVRSRPDVDSERLFFFGQSLGGAVAIVVAADHPEVRAIVVDSTFSGYRRVAARHLRKTLLSDRLARGVARLALSGNHDPIDVVERLSPRPLLVITSGADQICFPELGQELYEAAREPKKLWHVAEAGHTEALILHAAEAERRITQWFERAVAAGVGH